MFNNETFEMRSRGDAYQPVQTANNTYNFNNNELPLPSTARSAPKFSFTMKYFRYYLQENWSSILPIAIFAAVNLVIVVLFIIFHTAILEALNNLGLFLKTLGYLGMIIPILLIITASFPPVPGYGTVSVLCGFVYGFPIGFIPPLVGGILGSTCCFLLSRRYGKSYIRRILKSYTYVEAALKAVEIKGVKLLFLIRVAPYPWTIMNFVMGATSLTYFQFIFATTLSLPKLLLHTYIGSSAKSLLDGSGSGSSAKIAIMVFAITFGLGTTIYLYWLCKSIINDTLEENAKNSDHEDDEFSLSGEWEDPSQNFNQNQI